MTAAINRAELQNLCAVTEKALNWTSYVAPCVSSPLRSMFGTLQIVGGLTLAIHSAASSRSLDRGYKDLTFVGHGVANQVRSLVEAFLFFPLSLGLAAWDYGHLRHLDYDIKVQWVHHRPDPRK